jgi:hypothetical protein
VAPISFRPRGAEQGGQLCRRKQLSITGRLPNTIPTLPDTTEKRRSTTTVGITRKRHIMLTPQAVTPLMPEITLKKRERLTRRNTARSNIPEERGGGPEALPGADALWAVCARHFVRNLSRSEVFPNRSPHNKKIIRRKHSPGGFPKPRPFEPWARAGFCWRGTL